MKTHVLIIRMIRDCVSAPGFSVLYTAEAAPQIRDVYDRLLKHPLVAANLKHCRSTPQHEVLFRNGSKILLMCTKFPSSFRGPAYDLVIGDEIQSSFDRDSWEEVTPALITARRGKLIMAGQPRSKHFWTFPYYIRGIPKGILDPYSNQIGLGWDGYHSITCPSRKGALYQDEAGRRQLRRVREGMSGDFVWDRDYECHWIQDERKAAFPPDKVRKLFRGQPQPYIHGHRYCLGHDMGWSKDYGFTVVYDLTARRVAFAKRWPHPMKHKDVSATTDQRREVKSLKMQYRAFAVIDATGGGDPGRTSAYFDDYREIMPDIQPAFWNMYTKSDIVELLKYAIEQEHFTIPEGDGSYKILQDEISSYEREVEKGRVLYHAPEKCDIHDDGVMALALCFMAMKKGWVNQSQLTIPQFVR